MDISAGRIIFGEIAFERFRFDLDVVAFAGRSEDFEIELHFKMMRRVSHGVEER